MQQDKLSTYFATFIITLAGIGAGWVIVHMATKERVPVQTGNNEASFSDLKDSILKN